MPEKTRFTSPVLMLRMRKGQPPALQGLYTDMLDKISSQQSMLKVTEKGKVHKRQC